MAYSATTVFPADVCAEMNTDWLFSRQMMACFWKVSSSNDLKEQVRSVQHNLVKNASKDKLQELYTIKEFVDQDQDANPWPSLESDSED